MTDKSDTPAKRSRGELENAVMRALWRAGAPSSAKEVQATFEADATPAITTVLTILDRLHKKGSVVKAPAAGGGFVFSAAQSESESAASTMVSALVASSDRSAALLRFAGQLDPRDVEALRAALESD